MLDCGNGEIITITTFSDRASADTSMALAADSVRETVGAGFDLKRLEGFVGEVAVSRARAEALEPARY